MSILESVHDDIRKTFSVKATVLPDSSPDSPDWEWVAVLGSWILSLLIYIGGSIIYLQDAPVSHEVNTEALLPDLLSYIQPEPEERTLYIVGLLCIPTLPPFFFFCISWALARLPRVAKLCASQGITLVRDLLVIMGAILWFSCLVIWSQYPHLDAFMFASVVLVFFIPYVVQLRPVKRSWIIGVILAAVLGLTWYLMLFDDMRLIATGGLHHFNLLIGAILHVAQGRTILVDNTSQYGILYPYIAAACIAPFGLSVWNISQWFAVLGVIWYVLIGLAVGKRFGYNTWGFVVFFFGLIGTSLPSCCCEFNFISGRSFFGLTEILKFSSIGYQQYFPIRTFWCGVFFWLVFQCNGKNLRYWLTLGYVLAGIALLWNMDTGLVILLTWSGTWALDCLADRSRGIVHSLAGMILHAFLGASTAVISIVAYLIFARCRSGVWPNLAEFSQFQRVFYELGFFMIPMPLGELWQPVILIYATTVAWCVRKALQGRWDNDARWLFFVAIYGLGAFSYYQGRSAINNLAVMFFPVFLICFYWVACEMKKFPKCTLWTLLKQPQLRWKMMQITALSVFVMFSFLSYVRQMPALVNLAIHIHSEKPIAAVETEFADLRADFQGRKVVSMGVADALFCLETDSESLLPFSSTIEVCLKEQISKIQQAIDCPDVEYIVLTGGSLAEWPGKLDFHAFPYCRDVDAADLHFHILAKRLPDHSAEKWSCVNTANVEEESH